MFETYFKNEVARLQSHAADADAMWIEIKDHYSEPNRYYHTLLHLDHLFQQLLPIKTEIEDWHILIFSIAYHDIIYKATRKDNEEKSAVYAYDRLTKLGLPEHDRIKCKQQITATKNHQQSSDDDTNFFTDADLSVLGSDREAYFNYTLQIRKEYKIYPDFIYRPGRKKVVQHFLAMHPIFKTEYFRFKFEQQARINLIAELQTL